MQRIRMLGLVAMCRTRCLHSRRGTSTIREENWDCRSLRLRWTALCCATVPLNIASTPCPSRTSRTMDLRRPLRQTYPLLINTTHFPHPPSSPHAPVSTHTHRKSCEVARVAPKQPKNAISPLRELPNSAAKLPLPTGPSRGTITVVQNRGGASSRNINARALASVGKVARAHTFGGRGLSQAANRADLKRLGRGRALPNQGRLQARSASHEPI